MVLTHSNYLIQHTNWDAMKNRKDATKNHMEDLTCGPAVKNPPANAGDVGLIPSPGRSHMPQGR